MIGIAQTFGGLNGTFTGNSVQFNNRNDGSGKNKKGNRPLNNLLMLSLSADVEPLHIILADDDEDDRSMFEEAARQIKPNLKFQGAQNGEELMSLLTATSAKLPHVIFLDLNMPVKNGIVCLDEIRGNEKLKDVPVFIYSTSSNAKDIEETYRKGANLYVPKPNTYGGLMDLTKKIFHMNPKEYSVRPSRTEFVLSAK